MKPDEILGFMAKVLLGTSTKGGMSRGVSHVKAA